MQACRPWLCQGDVFEGVPLIRSSLGADGEPQFSELTGAALLLTHDCQIDKPVVPRLQFAPLTLLDDSGLDNSKKGQLRKGRVGPAEAVYIADDGAGREAVALLGEAFAIQAAYFELEGVDFAWHQDHDPARPVHAVARAHGNRTLTMEEDEVKVLRWKMMAFWTGVLPGEAPDQ